MRVLLAGGGTAGHINPAIAIANTIKKHHPDAEIAFVGNKGSATFLNDQNKTRSLFSSPRHEIC